MWSSCNCYEHPVSFASRRDFVCIDLARPSHLHTCSSWLAEVAVCLSEHMTFRLRLSRVPADVFFQHSGFGVAVVFRLWRLLHGLVLRSTPGLELRLSSGLGDCCWLDSCLHAVFVSRDLCPTAPVVRRHRAGLLEDGLRRFCYCLRHDYSRQSSGEFLVCYVTTASTLVTTCVVLFWCYAFSLDRHLHYIGYVRVSL